MDKNTTWKMTKWQFLSILLLISVTICLIRIGQLETSIDSQGLTPQSPGIYTSIDPQHPNRTIIVLDTGDARQALLAREAGLVLNQWGVNPALTQQSKGGTS